MTFEVEQKFPVDDPPAFEQAVVRLGASWGEAQTQLDTYYAHPSRDFAATDEALRIRRIGRANRITYKGPKLDPAIKTRRELEVSLAPGNAAAETVAGIFTALGFTAVAAVRKNRRETALPWQGRRITVTLDDVDELGVFCELELVVAEAELAAAKQDIFSLAERLRLASPERRSYLGMLLDKRT